MIVTLGKEQSRTGKGKGQELMGVHFDSTLDIVPEVMLDKLPLPYF